MKTAASMISRRPSDSGETEQASNWQMNTGIKIPHRQKIIIDSLRAAVLKFIYIKGEHENDND